MASEPVAVSTASEALDGAQHAIASERGHIVIAGCSGQRSRAVFLGGIVSDMATSDIEEEIFRRVGARPQNMFPKPGALKVMMKTAELARLVVQANDFTVMSSSSDTGERVVRVWSWSSEKVSRDQPEANASKIAHVDLALQHVVKAANAPEKDFGNAVGALKRDFGSSLAHLHSEMAELQEAMRTVSGSTTAPEVAEDSDEVYTETHRLKLDRGT